MPCVILRSVNMVDFTLAIRLDYIGWLTLTILMGLTDSYKPCKSRKFSLIHHRRTHHKFEAQGFSAPLLAWR